MKARKKVRGSQHFDPVLVRFAETTFEDLAVAWERAMRWEAMVVRGRLSVERGDPEVSKEEAMFFIACEELQKTAMKEVLGHIIVRLEAMRPGAFMAWCAGSQEERLFDFARGFVSPDPVPHPADRIWVSTKIALSPEGAEIMRYVLEA